MEKTKFIQTWWNDNLPNRLEEFNSWVGDKNAESKVYFRKYVIDNKFKSIIDLGCGNATEYFAYKEEYPELTYLGIDSCLPLCEANMKLGVPMLLSVADNVELPDSSNEVVFARHLLEHQPDFETILTEMIRLASKVAIHVFFITPDDKSEYIGYDKNDNLYHNKFGKKTIEDFLLLNDKVLDFEWMKINAVESGLVVRIK